MSQPLYMVILLVASVHMYRACSLCHTAGFNYVCPNELNYILSNYDSHLESDLSIMSYFCYNEDVRHPDQLALFVGSVGMGANKHTHS